MMREEVSILVVDDVNAMRVQVKELLNSFGFTKVQVAENGEQAKQMMETQTFHLFLVDWHMSPTDGFDLLKHTRSHPKYKDAAFVMVTAESTKDKVVEAVKSGVDDYLIKPLTLEAIQSKVYAALLKRQVLQS